MGKYAIFQLKLFQLESTFCFEKKSGSLETVNTWKDIVLSLFFFGETHFRFFWEKHLLPFYKIYDSDVIFYNIFTIYINNIDVIDCT